MRLCHAGGLHKFNHNLNPRACLWHTSYALIKLGVSCLLRNMRHLPKGNLKNKKCRHYNLTRSTHNTKGSLKTDKTHFQTAFYALRLALSRKRMLNQNRLFPIGPCGHHRNRRAAHFFNPPQVFFGIFGQRVIRLHAKGGFLPARHRFVNGRAA